MRFCLLSMQKRIQSWRYFIFFFSVRSDTDLSEFVQIFKIVSTIFDNDPSLFMIYRLSPIQHFFVWHGKIEKIISWQSLTYRRIESYHTRYDENRYCSIWYQKYRIPKSLKKFRQKYMKYRLSWTDYFYVKYLSIGSFKEQYWGLHSKSVVLRLSVNFQRLVNLIVCPGSPSCTASSDSILFDHFIRVTMYLILDLFQREGWETWHYVASFSTSLRRLRTFWQRSSPWICHQQ